MPQAVDLSHRHLINQLRQAGWSAAAIARQMNLPASTVRTLVRRFRHGDRMPLGPAYAACGRHARQPHPLLQPTRDLRQHHPRWGAGRIRVELVRLFPDQDVPTERTLQNWLRTGGCPVTAAGRPGGVWRRAERVHDTWEIDAAEQKRLASGALVSWLRVADECSGAILWSRVFPPGALQPSATGSGAAGTAGGISLLGAAGSGAGR